jgi:hypothetical protein
MAEASLPGAAALRPSIGPCEASKHPRESSLSSSLLPRLNSHKQVVTGLI